MKEINTFEIIHTGIPTFTIAVKRTMYRTDFTQ